MTVPPDPDRDRRHERLVRVALAENPMTAQVIQDALDAAGIRCMVKNRDGAAVMLGGIFTAPFALEVYVLEGDAAAASAILGGRPPAPPLPPPSVEGPRSGQPRRWWWPFGRASDSDR